MSGPLPSSFYLDIQPISLLKYRLITSQVLPIDQEKAFEFFENPRNLSYITPPWLDFCLLNQDSRAGVHENAEFDYTIKLLGIKIRWRSRISDYRPPERFTDIQVKGPYKSWVHLHVLEKVPEGTRMKDRVTYALYLPALMVHPLLIRKNLIDIFSYRAVKIAEWADEQK